MNEFREITCMKMSPNKKYLVIAHADGYVRVMNLASGEIVATFLDWEKNECRAIAITKDSKKLFVSGGLRNEL